VTIDMGWLAVIIAFFVGGLLGALGMMALAAISKKEVPRP